MKHSLRYKGIAALVLLIPFSLHWGGALPDPRIVAALIVCATVILWVFELLPLFVTSLLILFWQLEWLLPSLPESEVKTDPQIFLAPYFSNITLLFLGGFSISALMQRQGLDRVFASKILERSRGKPRNLLMGIVFVSAFLSMWVSNTATAALMMTMVIPLATQLKDDDPFRTALILSVPFACNLGGIGTPIGSPPNAIALKFIRESGLDLSFGGWVLRVMPLLVAGLFFLIWFLMKRFPPHVEKLEVPESTSMKWTNEQILSLVLFALAALGWSFGPILDLTSGEVGLLMVILIFGTGLLSLDDFRKLPWDILMMVAGGISLGVTLQVSGLDQSILALVPEHSHFLQIALLVGGLTALMTAFMSNTATASLLIPIALALTPLLDEKKSLALIVAIMCSASMPAPVSTPPNAIAYSSGLISMRNLFTSGVAIALVMAALVLLSTLTLWRFL